MASTVLAQLIDTRPVRTAWRAAWVRLCTPSLIRMLETWLLTVVSLTERLAAICLLALPRANNSRTSVSRSVRSLGARHAPRA